MCSFWVQNAKGPSSLGEVILTAVHWCSTGQAQLYKIISSLCSHHVHSDINHIRWNKPPSQEQSREDRMYILPTRSANKKILCQGKEDPLQHVYIFTKLFLHITALLEWSNYRVVHRRLWRTRGLQWCLLLWMMGNPFSFPLPKCSNLPREIWNHSSICHWLCLLPCKHSNTWHRNSAKCLYLEDSYIDAIPGNNLFSCFRSVSGILTYIKTPLGLFKMHINIFPLNFFKHVFGKTRPNSEIHSVGTQNFL